MNQNLAGLYWRVCQVMPAFGPVSMVLLNLACVVSGVITMGRLKPKSTFYTFAYAATIPAAMRGNLTPFMMVLAS